MSVGRSGLTIVTRRIKAKPTGFDVNAASRPAQIRFDTLIERFSEALQKYRDVFACFLEGAVGCEELHVPGLLAKQEEHSRSQHSANQDVRVEHKARSPVLHTPFAPQLLEVL